MSHKIFRDIKVFFIFFQFIARLAGIGYGGTNPDHWLEAGVNGYHLKIKKIGSGIIMPEKIDPDCGIAPNLRINPQKTTQRIAFKKAFHVIYSKVLPIFNCDKPFFG